MKRILSVFTFLFCAVLSYAQSNGQPASTTPGGDTILVNRKDKRFFEAVYNAETGFTFTEVKKVKETAKTITIELTYSEGPGSMLKILNPFAEQLVYKAELYNYKKLEFVETSTLPVMPGISSFEMWPFKIELIRLSGFKLQKEQ